MEDAGSGKRTSGAVVRVALEKESENAMMMANRFRYVFLLLLTVMMFVFRKDGTAAPSIIALLVFWTVTIVNTVVLRKHELAWSLAFNYLIVVLDCSIIFAMILMQSAGADGRTDYVLALKNENYWILLFPLILQVLQLRIKPVVLTISFMLAIQYFLVGLALSGHADLTTSFPEARMSGKLYLLDALLKRPVIVIIVGLVTIYSIYRAVSMVRRLADAQQQKVVLSRYFSPGVVEEITANPEVLRRGRRQKVAVLFMDIRDFTGLSEQISPDELVAFLAEFRERMSRVIFATGGSIDKFIGDAILATFGTPRPSPSAGVDSGNAVRAALGMRRELSAINARRLSDNLAPIGIGMGVHCGEVIAGNIGKGDLLEYSVIGDAVNTASRIQDLCKTFGRDLIVSRAVYDNLDVKARKSLRVQPLPATRVKGKGDPLQLLAIAGSPISA